MTNDPCPTIDSITNITIGGTYGTISTIDVVNEINYINEYKLEIRKKIAKFTINCIRIGAISKSYICGHCELQL